MRTISKITILIICLSYTELMAQEKMNFKFDTPYGNNESVGKYVELNGAKIYYEEYGSGEPLLLIHGNTNQIAIMGNQIEYFKPKYRVIIADSRGHGKSELKTDSLTFEQMAKDLEGLVEYLKLDSLNILGWSDGGILGLMMGINNKSKVKKIVAMGSNLRPDTTAVYNFAYNWGKKILARADEMIKMGNKDRDWNSIKQVIGLVINQPHISHDELKKINCPVLIVSGDKDIIREEHSVEIYQNIRHAQLCILPGETHALPASNPKLFNEISDRFLSEPFRRPDSDFTKVKK